MFDSDTPDDEDEADEASDQPSPVEEATPDDVDIDEVRDEATDISSDRRATLPVPAEQKSIFRNPMRRLTAWVIHSLIEENEWLQSYRQTVKSANVNSPASLFIGRVISYGLVSAIGLFIITAVAGIAYLNFLGDPSIVIQGVAVLVSLLGSLLLVGVIAAGILGYISYTVSERKREINSLLGDAVSYMYTESAGGMNQLDIVRTLAEAEDSYGEVSREFQAILKMAEYFGEDYEKALSKQAQLTPSDELARFLTDMLTVIRSGGNLTAFLENETDEALRTAREEQKGRLDVLELVAEVYLTASLFPLMAIIILILLSSFQNLGALPLFFIVYGVIPIMSLMFIFLISGIRKDEVGDGKLSDRKRSNATMQSIQLQPPDTQEETDTSIQSTLSGAFGSGLGTLQTDTEEQIPSESPHIAASGLRNFRSLNRYRTAHTIFDKVAKAEFRRRVKAIFSSPVSYFREKPLHTLPISAFVGVIAIVAGVLLGYAPLPTPSNFLEFPLRTTVWWLHVPLFSFLGPLALFYELKQRRNNAIFRSFPKALRKIASANDAGMTLLESISSAASDQEDKIDEELELIAQKARLGTPLEKALIEFNNTYESPQVSRITRLIIEAQRASEQISDVLETAIQTAENQIELADKRRQQTQIQMIIILVTTVIILGAVLMMDRIFLPIISQGGLGAISGNPNSGSSGIGPDAAGLIFLHAVTVHAVFSGLLAGYIQSASLLSGVKFILGGLTAIGVAWVVF